MAEGAGRTLDAALLCIAVRGASRCSARASSGPCTGTIQCPDLAFRLPLHEPASARDGYRTTGDARFSGESWVRATDCDFGLWSALGLSLAIQARAAHDSPWCALASALANSSASGAAQRWLAGFALGRSGTSPGESRTRGRVPGCSRSGTFAAQVRWPSVPLAINSWPSRRRGGVVEKGRFARRGRRRQDSRAAPARGI